jgi:hypothetical protein
LKVGSWPILVYRTAQPKRRRTAKTDPIQPFEEKLSNVRFAGPIRLTLALLLDEGANLSGI